MQPIRVTLVSQRNCHLCDEARQVIERVLDAGKDFAEIEFSELGLADHPELAEAYAEYVPVVLVDDIQHSAFTVREDRLAEAIVTARNERLLNDGKPRKRNWLQRLARRSRKNSASSAAQASDSTPPATSGTG